MSKHKTSGRAPARRDRPLLDSLTGDDAIAILRQWADRSDELAREVEAAAARVLAVVDVDQVAAEVRDGFESLTAEDLWDRSGPRHGGYADALDSAGTMIDEVVQPSVERVECFRQLDMPRQADLVCRGILRGVYAFGVDSATEFEDAAIDIAPETFDEVLRTWRELDAGQAQRDAMVEYLRQHCPRWAEAASATLRARR